MSVKSVKEHLPWAKKIIYSARELAEDCEKTLIGNKEYKAQMFND